MHEHTPYGHRAWIVSLLFGKSTIDRRNDVTHHGKHSVWRVPKLHPLALEDAAALWLRRLLQPAARHVRAQLGFDSRNLLSAEPLRPHQCALALLENMCGLRITRHAMLEERLTIVVQATRVLPPKDGHAMSPALVFHRNHEMAEI